MTVLVVDAAAVVDLVGGVEAVQRYHDELVDAAALAAPAHPASLQATLVTTDGRLRRAASEIVDVA